MSAKTALKKAQQKYNENLKTLTFKFNPNNPIDKAALEKWKNFLDSENLTENKKQAFIKLLNSI